MLIELITFTVINRFVNYTREAIKAIAEQLGLTSKMVWENWIIVDMILVEKGGRCVMIGGQCCTFIPKNTAPDGTITKAFQDLTTLANELAENLVIDDPFISPMEQYNGRWKRVMMSILTSLIIVFGVMTQVGWYNIPCV
jgi:hypothetical protein